MILHSAKDISEEDRVAMQLSMHWKCSFNRYPQMSRIDWWLGRGDKLLSFAEMKRRYHNHDKYRTVFLSFAKWAALVEMAVSASCKGHIIYAFDDGIWHADATIIDPRRVGILGRKDRVGVGTDLEPIIKVPVSSLTQVMLPQPVSEQTNEEWLNDYRWPT